jgi:hypothetical protein
MTDTSFIRRFPVPTPLPKHRKILVPIETLMHYDYVRESITITSAPWTMERRRRTMFGAHNILIAYCVLRYVAPYTYEVGIWLLKTCDRPLNPNGAYQLAPSMINDDKFRRLNPAEAVPPGRVLEFFPEHVNTRKNADSELQ